MKALQDILISKKYKENDDKAFELFRQGVLAAFGKGVSLHQQHASIVAAWSLITQKEYTSQDDLTSNAGEGLLHLERNY